MAIGRPAPTRDGVRRGPGSGARRGVAAGLAGGWCVCCARGMACMRACRAVPLWGDAAWMAAVHGGHATTQALSLIWSRSGD